MRRPDPQTPPAGSDPAAGGLAAGSDPAADPGDRVDRRLYLLALTVVAGVLMPVLNTTIVVVAIDALGTALGSPLVSVQWVLTGYLLALAVVVPLAGWAVDRFGAARVWLAAIAGFTMASALCAVAWNLESLIAFRVLQGLAGGMLLPVGHSLLAIVAGPRRMGRVMGIFGMPMVLAPILGPILGGVFVQEIGWRWLFLINLPMGALAAVLAVWMLPGTAPRRRGERLDLPGLGLLSGALVAILYGLSHAGADRGFGGAGVLLPVLVGIGLLVGFGVRGSSRGARAIIDVNLLRNRFFAAALANTFLLSVVMYGTLLLLPLYYQLVRGEGALRTGLLLMPLGLGAATSIPICARLTDRFGPRLPMLAGLGCTGAGLLALTQIGAGTAYPMLTAALYLNGMGVGAMMTPNMVAAYVTLPAAQVPRASSAYAIVRQVGASFGTALLAVLLARNLDSALPGAGSQPVVSGGPDDGLVAAQAAAFNQTFWVAFGVACLMIVSGLLLPGRPPAAQEAAAREAAAREEPVRGNGSAARSGLFRRTSRSDQAGAVPSRRQEENQP